MRQELMAIANTRYGDKYLFGGTRTDSAPFDPTTGAFSGNDQVVRVPVMDGVTPASNISGATAFTSAAGGRDIFADLDALATALSSNDENGIRAALTPLQDGHAQLVRSQVDAGFGAERFRNALDVLMSTKSAIAEQLSKEIEGDPATQLTELNLARTAYEQSIAVTKHILSIKTT
jgi:flagellar hook-associated protein 3 FlgL